MNIGLLAAVAAVSAASAAEDCRVPLDRSLTLRSRFPFAIETKYGRMAAGESRLAFTLPRPVGAECGDSGPAPLLAFPSPDSAQAFSVRLMAGEEYRNDGDGVYSTEVGGVFQGTKGPASAHLDARMFSEMGGDATRPSFDRESADDQKEGVTGSVDYRSYARFRGDFNLDLAFGRLTVARDAAHWGPGLYGNAVLSQEAVPFYQYVYAARIGPLSITSLYGDLQIGDNQNSSSGDDGSRNLFAHRYELALGANVLLGISEQLILFDASKAYLFAPIFPLFIAKSLMVEESSNGNIAFDATWRLPWKGLVYGEFMLDDLESPSSLLVKDYAQNKWSALAGTHFVRDFPWARAGLIAEYSHVEPWVYSHFKPNTAQSLNLGVPLGNPYGPDSRTLILKPYARFRSGLYAGIAAGLFWKGHGPGADPAQPSPQDPLTPKNALAGETAPDFAVEPRIAYAWKWFAAALDARLGDGGRVAASLRAFL